LAIVGLVLELTILRPVGLKVAMTVGPIRTMVSVRNNLTSGISTWTDGTIVFSDGDEIRALEPGGTEWVVTQLEDKAQIRDVYSVPNGPLYFSADDGTVREYFGAKVTVLVKRPTVSSPRGLARTPDGDLYFDDIASGGVFRRSASGQITRIATLDMPDDMATNPSGGAVYVVDSEGSVYKVIGGRTLRKVFNVEAARPPAQKKLPGYLDICFTPDGDLIVSDELANTIWRVHSDHAVRVVGGQIGGTSSPDGVPANEAAIIAPWAVDVTNDYRLIVSESGALRVVQLIK
jgi:DNA-binding beta-propeller fold protein YncE